MKTETKYQYQKRIKELEKSISRLKAYETFSNQILNASIEMIGKGCSLSNAYIMQQAKNWILK